MVMFSCNKDNEATLPAYIYIDSVVLKTKPSLQGAPTHNISEFWVFADGKPLGAFAKDKIIPVIADDYNNVELQIFAGIRENGIKSNVNTYYLYKDFNIKKALKQGEVDTIDVVYEYVDYAKFVFIEGFENSNIFTVDEDEDPLTKIELTKEEVCSGQFSGKIVLTKEHNKFIATSQLDYYEIPTKGNLIYLELDYKGDIPFIIGVSGKDESGNEYKQDIILLKNKENWNKIYLNLTNTIQESALQSYRIYFSALHNEKADTSLLYFDNIKLLYSDR